MPRPAKIWFRKATGWWMVTHAGKQVKLAQGRSNRKAAEQKFHELKLVTPQAPEASRSRVCDVVESFLTVNRPRLSAETMRNYDWYGQAFAERWGYRPSGNWPRATSPRSSQTRAGRAQGVQRLPLERQPVIGAEVAAEMARAFGWDVPPTDEELEAQYAARRCDEEELLARFPGLYDKPDGELIGIVADPLMFFIDADEAAAAAAIILQRRLDGITIRPPV